MGNKNKRRANRNEDEREYIIVPIKQKEHLVLLKRTGMQPFPKLPAFTVAIKVMQYAGI